LTKGHPLGVDTNQHQRGGPTDMLLHQETWMNIRAFKKLRSEGANYVDIARETGCDWRTVKKYLAEDAPVTPPVVKGRTHPPRVIDPYAAIIDEWLAREPLLAGTVIFERLVAEYGFTHTYQRVKLYLQEARPRIAPRREDLHRRFEVLPGSQAQVDWGDEGSVDDANAYSFHMTLSNSRDPFTCIAPSQDLASFWGCHVRAFHHFGGVPAEILYDRTKTVVKRHVGRDMAVPLHPEALAFCALRLRDQGGGPLPTSEQGSRRAPGENRARARTDGTQLRVARRDGRGVYGVAADSPRPGAPHPRPGDCGESRDRPGGPRTTALNRLPRQRAPLAQRREGLPRLL
jgi:transposase